MMALALAPFGIQAIAIMMDELVFHRRRVLPRWERISHPIDTFSQLVCLCLPLFMSFSRSHLYVYIAFAGLSCALITKDEKVHVLQHCSWKEHWLHSVLFIVHPLVLASIAFLWAKSARYPWFFGLLKIQVLLMIGFGLYQIIYWSFYAPTARSQ
jgi:hypothetical protein